MITDVASTKAVIVQRAAEHRLRFVGGHPLAGRETSGYGSSDPTLFRDRPWVIIPPEPGDDAGMDRVAGLARACGARPLLLSAADHDAAVAAISHVPLVIAAALVEAFAGAPDWETSRALAAGGWASMTRLALGDPAMGAGIVATNGGPIAERLREVRAVIDDWLAAIESDDPGAAADVLERFGRARSRIAPDPDR